MLLPNKVLLFALLVCSGAVAADEVNARTGPPLGVGAKVERYQAFHNRLSADSDSIHGSDSAWSNGGYGAVVDGQGNQVIGCITTGAHPRGDCTVVADDIININTGL